MTTPPAFRLDLGATWLDLLATRGSAFGQRPEERIPDTKRLADWLEAVELTPTQTPSDADLTIAYQLRETLRPIALAVATGEEPPHDETSALMDFLAEHDEPVRLVIGSGLHRPAPADTAAALGRIARQAAEHLTGAERHGLKVCPESDCRGVFTDVSGRRRWCPSPACASRGRVRAHRSRQKEL